MRRCQGDKGGGDGVHLDGADDGGDYGDGGVSSWKLSRARFVAGGEVNTKKGRVGQLMGHIARVRDSSNAFSMSFVPMDLCLLLWELEGCGWERQEFFSAFDRLVEGSPNLTDLCRATLDLAGLSEEKRENK